MLHIFIHVISIQIFIHIEDLRFAAAETHETCCKLKLCPNSNNVNGVSNCSILIVLVALLLKWIFYKRQINAANHIFIQILFHL